MTKAIYINKVCARALSLALLMLASAFFMGCTDHDEPAGTELLPLQASLTFAVPESSGAHTRMADNVIQTSPAFFRGLKDIKVIPLKSGDPDANSVIDGGEDAPVALKDQSAFYYFDNCEFPIGTNQVLVYARGSHSVKDGDDLIPETNYAYYGHTEAEFPENMSLTGITFRPVSICPNLTDEAKSKAEDLAGYLTAIVKTEGWAATSHSDLKALYLNFMNKTADGKYPVIAGSSANILAFVSELYDKASEYKNDEGAGSCNKICDAINEGARVDDAGHVTALKDELSGYPANIGLPDGSVAMQWDATDGKFKVYSAPTFEVAITNTKRFAYPAELYYYVRSAIRTAPTMFYQSAYQEADSWNALLEHYSPEVTQVRDDTRSVAVVNPVEYGVAQLRVLLKQTSDKLKDANDEYVTVGSTNFPLTAVIVGGQYPVGCDFAPVGTEDATEKDMLFVYDSQVKTNKVTADGTAYDYYYLNSTKDVGTANTLVLQTYDNPEKAITIVLEFENRSGKKFAGHDGTVYPGTKFYLIGKVTPKDGEAADGTDDTVVPDLKKRLFTKDHITQVNVKVTSLENAYNVMPDLLAPRLEIGVELERDWDALMPSTTELLE